METEIIKTDDENIVIERTIIDKEINIGGINSQLASFENRINEIALEVQQLEQSKGSLPNFIVELIDEKIYSLLSEKATSAYQVELLNNEINKLNG